MQTMLRPSTIDAFTPGYRAEALAIEHRESHLRRLRSDVATMYKTLLYSEGVTTLIELLDAERELSQSRNLHTQSLINVQTSLVKAHKANGTLLTDFIKTL